MCEAASGHKPGLWPLVEKRGSPTQPGAWEDRHVREDSCGGALLHYLDRAPGHVILNIHSSWCAQTAPSVGGAQQ